MPKDTFNNLKSERKQAIIDIAIEEFARCDFASASLSAIIRRLGLAKGSFYRYFATKKELYLYLIDYIIKKRYERLTELAGTGMDFFQLLRQNFIDKLDHDILFPNESLMAYNLINEKNDPDLVALARKLKDWAVTRAEEAMLPHVQSGKLRADIPVRIMAYTVVQLQFALLEIIRTESKGQDADGTGPVFTMPRQMILKHVDEIIELLKHGIQKK